jgi:hypothetical protein
MGDSPQKRSSQSASLNRLRVITQELNNRDVQLKKNANAFWFLFEKLQEMHEVCQLSSPHAEIRENLMKKIQSLIEHVESLGCKRCNDDETKR